MTIYLYVKTHRKTGLKYLGKTESKDPHKYHGSGKYWSSHIKTHGYDVHTEIIRECETNEEVRQWGLYYSELWQVVESDGWANLKEEAGDGCTSEQARQNNLKRVKNGTHHFLDGEFARQNNLKRLANGTHHLLGNKINRQRVEDGTHNWLGGEIQRQNALKRVEDGTHLFVNSEFQRQNVLKRVADGTHNFLGDDAPSKQHWVCDHCGIFGQGKGNFTRWHKNGKCLK